MRIAILGSGNMGGTLGRLFATAGHSVAFSFSRDRAKLERLARQSGPRTKAATPREAAASAEVVLLSVLWAQMPAVLKAAGTLRGKTVIDCTNPMTPADDDSTSAASRWARAITSCRAPARRAPRVVRAKT